MSQYKPPCDVAHVPPSLTEDQVAALTDGDLRLLLAARRRIAEIERHLRLVQLAERYFEEVAA